MMTYVAIILGVLAAFCTLVLKAYDDQVKYEYEVYETYMVNKTITEEEEL